MAPLENAHCGLGFCSEVAVYNHSDFCLHLLHQRTVRRTTQRGPASRSAWPRRRLGRRDQRWGRSGSSQDRGDGCTERIHVEVRIVFATGGQSIFLVSGAEVSGPSNVLQNGSYSALIGIYLHGWPGRIVRQPGILRLNADETGVAGGHSFPRACPGVIAPPGGDHKERTVAAKAKLSQRARKVGAPLEKGAHAWHVAIPRPCGVVAYDAHGSANIATPTVLPAINQRDFQTAVLQRLR